MITLTNQSSQGLRRILRRSMHLFVPLGITFLGVLIGMTVISSLRAKREGDGPRQRTAIRITQPSAQIDPRTGSL